jgi:hypothetical protein
VNYFNYFTEIEDTFIRRRGKNLFLSPIDWAMIESWQERQIPLHVVIRSIESVFDVYDQHPQQTRSIKTLLYCREEIEAQYAEWTRSQVGKSSDTGEQDNGPELDAIKEHIDKSIEALDAIKIEPLREDVERAIVRLRELGDNLAASPEAVEGMLADIEKVLDRSMLTNWDPQHLKVLEKEVASQLKAYKSEMEPEAYENAKRLMLLKRLREETGMPRLGLYYL